MGSKLPNNNYPSLKKNNLNYLHITYALYFKLLQFISDLCNITCFDYIRKVKKTKIPMLKYANISNQSIVFYCIKLKKYC